MKIHLMVVFFYFVLGLALVFAESSESSQVTKLEVVDLGEVTERSADTKSPESQRKRDSGYVYNRPDRLSSGQRFNGHGYRQNPGHGYRGKILAPRYPSQSHRILNSYGAPPQSQPIARPSGQYGSPQNIRFDDHRNQFHDQHNSHGGQHRPGQSSHQNNGLVNQEAPNPVRYNDFLEPESIASQNNEPFGLNTANYLPPKNQELPIYSAPTFLAPGQEGFHQPNAQLQTQSSNFGAQSFPQNQAVTEAAHFLHQNAQAISQLYGAPEQNQNFAPTGEEFFDQGSQVQGFGGSSGQLQGQQQGFQGALPSYASGTLNADESLAQIQSKEKDRIIVQLQALLSQSESQNAELSSQYARNHGNYIQNQNLLASLSSQISSGQNQNKYVGQQNPNVNPFNFGSFVPANTAFGQTPYIPGGSTPASFTTSYGFTTQQTPITSTTTTTTIAPPVTPGQSNPSGDGSSQSGTSLPAPSQVTPAASFPQYGGFVPTYIAGTNFIGAVPPTFGPTGSGFVPLPVQPSGSSPTHFGLPIPQDSTVHNQPQPSPSNPNAPATTPATSTTIGQPVAVPAGHPLQPIHPVHSIRPLYPAVSPPLAPAPIAPLHPVSTQIHSVQQFHPVPNPVHPVSTNVHPLLPVASGVTPIQSTLSPHPIGTHTSVLNPLLYKPLKNYPVLYYPNLQYQVQKPVLPTYPWTYAPAFPQAKPAQIWK